MRALLDLLRRLFAGPGLRPPGTAGQVEPVGRRGPSHPVGEPHPLGEHSPSSEHGPSGTFPRAGTTAYPGDYDGLPAMRWAPKADGRPDPGEIVWTWVPFEEDHTQGKDRPVLLIGLDGPWLLGLQLTSKDHDRDAVQERRAGRVWVDIGSGHWDRQGRPSEVRVNRILRVAPDSVRREGSVLAEATFAQVVAAVRAARSSAD